MIRRGGLIRHYTLYCYCEFMDLNMVMKKFVLDLRILDSPVEAGFFSGDREE